MKQISTALCGAFGLLFSAQAGIFFGDQDSRIVIEGGSLVVTGNLTLDTGKIEIGPSGTLDTSGGNLFYSSTGTVVDNGESVVVYTNDTTLQNDVRLSGFKSLTIAAPVDGVDIHAVIISGSGEKIIFSQEDAGVQLIIGPYTAVTFEHIELVGLRPEAVQLGTGASITIASGGLTLDSALTGLNFPLNFTSPDGASLVRGNGNLLSFTSDGVFTVADGNQLIMDGVHLWQVAGNPVQPSGTGAITLRDCSVTTATGSTPFSIVDGQWDVVGKLTLDGYASVVYASSFPLVLGTQSSLEVNRIALAYQSVTLFGGGKLFSTIALKDAQFLVGSLDIPVLTVSVLGLKLASYGTSLISGFSAGDGGPTQLVFGDAVHLSNNSTLSFGDGKLSLTDVVVTINDGNA